MIRKPQLTDALIADRMQNITPRIMCAEARVVTNDLTEAKRTIPDFMICLDIGRENTLTAQIATVGCFG